MTAGSSQHPRMPLGQIHTPHNWEFANAAARLAAGAYAATDVGKWAWQTDNNTIWLLLTTAPTWLKIGGSEWESYAKLEDQKAANTGGGAATTGSWETRDLDPVVNDDDGIVSLAANQFTLQAGTYIIKAAAPAFDVNRHKAKLYNVSDAADEIIGTSEYANASGNGATSSVVSGQFTIAAEKVFEIQHYVETNKATNGHGVESNFGVTEVYTVVEIWKVG